MKNNKGQSLIEIVFSIGTITLVLTGVAVLIVNVVNAKRVSAERQMAITLSQKLIEDKILDVKNDPVSFWNGTTRDNNKGEQTDPNFVGYKYKIEYGIGGKSCDENICVVNFTVVWGDPAKESILSVERLFSKTGI